MAQVVYKDGSPVPPEKVQSAIASGEAFTSADMVTVRNERTGEIGTIDPGELAHAGHYSVLSDEEMQAEANHAKYGTLGQQALTGVEGAARGVTIGGSDVALSHILGDQYRQGAKAREEENPTIAAASEIGGAVAPAVLTGGASAEVEGGLAAAEGGGSLLRTAARFAPSELVTGAGRAVERGVAGIVGDEAPSMLGRMAQRAAAVGASGATEGGLYGAGHAASESALDGTPITAEKVLSGFGHGALFGGALGVGLGAAGGFGSAAFDKIVGGSEGLREGARKLASESALKSAGFIGQDFKKAIGRRTGEAAGDAVSDLGSELLDYTFDSGPLKGKKLFTGAQKAEDFVDDLALAKQEVGAKLGAIKRATNDAALANPEIAPNVETYLQRVNDEVLAPLRASSSPTIRKQAERVRDELSLLQQRVQPVHEAEALMGGAVEGPPAMTFSELDAFRKDLRSVFQPPRPSAGGLPAPVPEHAAHLEAAERILADELDKSVEKHLASAGLDTTEYARNKKTYGALADIEKVANRATAQQLGNRAISPSDYASGLGTAIGMMLTGNVGALAVGGATTIAHKLIRERGRGVLAVMADSVAKMDGRISAAAKTLAGVAEIPRRAAIEVEPSMVDRFDKVTSDVKAVRDNAQYAAAALAKPIEGIAPHHPQLAAQMQQTLQGDYQYLATKLPLVLSRSGNSITPQAEKSKVPHAEKVKFMSVVAALESPDTVMAKIEKGAFPRLEIEALKVRRPEMFNQMRQEIIKESSSAKKPIGFRRRTLLSLAFDFQGDASIDPQTLGAIQSSNRIAAPPEDAPQLAPSATQPQPRAVHMDPKTAQSLTTPAQKAIGA